MVKDNIENPCSSYDVVVDTINNNGVYVNDKNVDVYEVDVQPDLQEKTVEYTENGEYLLNLQAKINVSIPNTSTAVTITENGSTILIPDSGYYNQVTVNTNVQPELQEKEVQLGYNDTVDITADTDYYGLRKVTVATPEITLQNKTLNVTENGSTTLMPDEGYYALNQVHVNVNVPNPELESKTVDIYNNGSINITPDSKYGLSNVKINTNVHPALQNKNVEYTENGEYTITNDDGFYGLKQAKINVSIPNTSTAVTITENGSTILRPDNGYYNEVDINVQIPNTSTAVTINQNGTTTLRPDSGYFNQVDINVDVPNPELESKIVEITENGSTNIMPDSKYGLSNVIINTNVQPELQNKTVEYTENGEYSVTNDEGFYGLKQAKINVSIPNSSTAVTITENGSTTLTPDSGYYNQVDINVNVPDPELESKTVDITSNGTQTIRPDSAYGLSVVTINTNVQPNLQNKDVTITKNGTTKITKDDGFDGLGNVTINTNVECGGSIGNYIEVPTPFTGGKILGSTLDITKWDLNIQQYNSTFEGFGVYKIILPIDYFYVENRNDLVSSSLFENCISLTNIENIDKTRISIKSFNKTFNNCKKLTSLDLSYKPEYNYWDMSVVKDISYMFNECNGLTTLNIDGWDRSKISYSQYAFATCSNLRGIIRLSAHNAIDNNNTFSRCNNLQEIYYDNDGYDNIEPNKEVCNMSYFAYLCMSLKKVSIKGRKIYRDGFMFSFSNGIEWVDMTGCDYSKYMSGDTSTSNAEPYHNCSKLKTLIGDHTLAEVENGDITIYDGLGLSQPRFGSYYFSPLSSLRYSSMLALAKGLGQHTYSSTQYIRFNQTAWDNMRNDDDTIPDSNTITQRQNTLTDLITGKGWSIQYANS